MKIKITKKLIAIFCTAMMATSAMSSVNATTYSDGNNQTEKQKTYVQTLNKTIPNYKSKSQEIKGKLQSNFAHNENYYNDTLLLINSIQNTINKLDMLRVPSRTAYA